MGKPPTRLFVYGLLLSGEVGHGKMRGAEPLGPARTAPEYELVNLGRYPALLEGGDRSIVGELYRVDDDLLAVLDEYEECPEVYRRLPVHLLGADPAVAYVLPRALDRSFPRILSGDWRKRA